jgi:hypothetical protein
MLVSLGDGSAFEQPGRLQLQPAFAGLGITLPIRLDNQTQAGVFTKGTDFAHGGYAQKYSKEGTLARAAACGMAGVLWKESEK